jgi:hypothetical protein
MGHNITKLANQVVHNVRGDELRVDREVRALVSRLEIKDPQERMRVETAILAHAKPQVKAERERANKKQ